jgi:hypothetical protein
VFGDSDWESELSGISQQDAVRRVVALYKRKLLSLPDVKYAFAFEMRKMSNQFDYHLVFASQHQKGLVKMKEVMRKIDKTGSYCFSDASVGQHQLFKYDDPNDHAQQLIKHFSGMRVPYGEVNGYALNDSPFANPKSMLRVLEQSNRVQIECGHATRRKGTFPEAMQQGMFIQFGAEVANA